MYAGGDGVYQVAVANEAPLDKIRKTKLLWERVVEYLGNRLAAGIHK